MAKKGKSLEESKKKKVPFNVLRKGAIAGLLGLTIGFGCLGLAGCSLNGTDGKDGLNGKDGAQWYSGIETPTTQGVNGDYYYDTDDYLLYQKTNGEWKILIRDFGKKGDDAVAPTVTINADGYWVINGIATDVKAKGEDGSDGSNGSTPTITIVDGYWAINGTKTSTKAEAIDGTDGEDGNIWTVGSTYPSTPNTGDMFLNNSTWDVYQYNGTTWDNKGNIKGGTGATGGNGQAGQDGKDGTNIYVGYDGYVWQDGLRTTFKLDQDTEGRENVVEDTIGAYTTMGYWKGEYVDLSTNTIALMANYKPNAKLTQYSGTKVTEIQVVAESAGTLHIGTAKVADVVTARTNCTTYTATTTSYNVTAGVNTITLDLTVAEDETIVLGGSNSTAKVYVVKNLPVSDEQGNFTLVDSTTHTDVLAQTGDYADTLAVSVKASVQISTQLVSGYDAVKNLTGTSSGVIPCAEGNMPFVYSNTSYFTNKTITKIQLLLSGETFNQGNAGTALQDETEYTFDISVIAVNSLVSGGTFNIKRTYTLRVKGKDVVANAWNEFDISDLGIVVSEGETLGFGSSSSTLANKYSQNNVSNSLHYWGKTSASDEKLKERTTMNLLVGIEGLSQSGGAEAFALHLAELEKKEQEIISKNA